MDDLGCLKPFVERAAAAAGFTAKEARQLRLAVEEAVVNVVCYAHATAITLMANAADGRLALTIDDDGCPFDPTGATPTDLAVAADERPPGGLGIVLMRQLTNALSYERREGHNILRIEKQHREA